jgi:hypothetical protein
MFAEQSLDSGHHVSHGTLRDCSLETHFAGFAYQFGGNLLHREQQHGKFGVGASYLFCGLQAVHLRHGQIKHNQVGMQFAGLKDRVMSIYGLAAYFPLGLTFEYSPDQSANGEIIVSNQNARQQNLSPFCEPVAAPSSGTMKVAR